MTKKKCVALICIATLIIMCVTLGVSYAYWRQTLVQTGTNELSTGCFNITLTNEENAINLQSTIPISDESGRQLTPFTFKLTNTCDVSASYTLSLEVLANTTLSTSYVDSLLNDGSIKRLSSLNNGELYDESSIENRVLEIGTLSAHEEKDYSLRIWLDKDVTINDDTQNKVFKSKIVINSTPTEEAMAPKIICKRATVLHTDGETTYGNLGEDGTINVGDAFTCDVNGDDVFDEETERFYYISDYSYFDYDKSSVEFRNDVAVLTYYTDTLNGEIIPNTLSTDELKNTTVPYDNVTTTEYKNATNNNGPLSAVTHLPTTTQWSNVSLFKDERQIVSSIGLPLTYSGAIRTFDYTGYAARLITGAEIANSCKENDKYALKEKCDFLFENYYTSEYLESPSYSSQSGAAYYFNTSKYVTASVQDSYGMDVISASGRVRPVIEVKKMNIDFGGEAPTFNEPIKDIIPVNNMVCKRATVLHEATCESDNCTNHGLDIGSKVTFGNLKTTGLKSGDTFDCDVNGDGVYDSTSERFYYVTDLDSDNEYAVLAYSANYKKDGNYLETPFSTAYSGGDYDNRSFGPQTIHLSLPSKTEWKNVRLSNEFRDIYDDKGVKKLTFYYSTASRVLSTSELNKACEISSISYNNQVSNCMYLFENSVLFNPYEGYSDFWLENPVNGSASKAWFLNMGAGRIRTDGVSYDHGVKPVIEVKKNYMEGV